MANTGKVVAVLCLLCFFGIQPAAGEEEAARRRFDVNTSVGVIGFKDPQVDHGLALLPQNLSLSYNTRGPLAFQVSGGVYDSVDAYQLSVLWRFRRDKQFIPYLLGGYGFYDGKQGVVSAFAGVGCAITLILTSCSRELANTRGPHAGVGFKAYLTEKRRWSLEFDLRYLFLRETDSVMTLYPAAPLLGPPAVTRERVKPHGYMFQLGVGYSF